MVREAHHSVVRQCRHLLSGYLMTHEGVEKLFFCVTLNEVKGLVSLK
jgi:pyridoxal/pyridoxine/pyridoxamine kinase